LALALGQGLGLWRLQDLAGSAPDLCLFHRATGLPCPGCGMGRALLLLAQGRFSESWAAHPFALPLLGLAWIAALLPAARFRGLIRHRWATPAFGMFLGLVLLHWIQALLRS
jgi:hypothetical protein